MALIYLNDCGKSYDTASAALELFTNLDIGFFAIANDVVLGNYIHITSGHGALPSCWGYPFAAGSLDIIYGTTAKLTPATNLSSQGSTWQFSDGVNPHQIRLTSTNQFTNVAPTGGAFGTPYISPPLPFNPALGWHRYEFHFGASNLNTVNGFMVIHIDGQPFFDTGMIATFSTFGVIGVPSVIDILNAGPYQETDVIVLDSTGGALDDFLGTVKVLALFPSADGDTIDWTPSTAGTHFNLVNSQVPGGPTYVQSDTANQVDEYLVGNPPGNTIEILIVSPKFCLEKLDVTNHSCKPVYKQGGTQVYGVTFGVGVTSYSEYQPEYLRLNPVSGSVWSVADLNNTQFGIRLIS